MTDWRGASWNLWLRAAFLGLFLALGLHPRPLAAQAAYRRGLELLAQQPAAALPDLLTAHRAWPERPDIALQAAEAAWAAAQPALCAALIRHAQRLAPLPAWAYARWSAAEALQGHRTAALEALQQGLAAYPHSSDLLQRLALLAQAQGRDDLARAALEDWVAQGQAPAAERWRLALLLTAHEPAAALPHLQALASDPAYGPQARALQERLTLALRENDRGRQQTLAGEALLAQGEPRLAETALRRAVAFAPTDATAWAYLGAALEAQGREGLPALRHAQGLAPHAPLPNLLLGTTWLRRGHPERALPWLLRAAQAAPQDPYPALQVAAALFLLPGNQARAQVWLQRAQTLASDRQPAFWSACAQMALAHHLPPEHALPCARRAAALKPQDPQAALLLAQALLEQGDEVTAQRLLLRLQQQRPGFAPAYLYLSVAALQAGQPRQAREYLRWARALGPTQSPAWQARLRTLETWLAALPSRPRPSPP